MQLFIDTSNDSPAALRDVAAFLLILANGDSPRLDADAPGPTEDFEPLAPHRDPSVVFAPQAVHGERPAPTMTIVPPPPAAVTLDTLNATTNAANAAAMARINAGGAGQGPTSFESLNVPAPPAPPPPSASDNAAAGAGTPFQTPPVAAVVTAPAAPIAATAAGSPTIVPAGTPPVLAGHDPTALRDRDGLPHDTRIHSVTPTIKADGRWRQRRNLDNSTLVAVEAELRASAPQVMVPPPPAHVVPPPPASVVVPPPPAATVMVPPPPPVAGSVPPGPPADAVAPARDSFRALMDRIGPHTGEGGRLAVELMKPIHAQFGATGWGDYVGKCKAQIPALNGVLDGMLS